MNIQYSEVGVCGLSCMLCPMHHTQTESRCRGCKSQGRIAVRCPFINCAVKKKGVEFCWGCSENSTCDRWKKHREAGKQRDSFKCYQTLENDIALIRKKGVVEFVEQQKTRENILKKMLFEFNDGRSKSYYCIAASVLEIGELQKVLVKARQRSGGMQLKEKTKVLHSMLEQISQDNGYLLKLRK
jgi:hypothetical protein